MAQDISRQVSSVTQVTTNFPDIAQLPLQETQTAYSLTIIDIPPDPDVEYKLMQIPSDPSKVSGGWNCICQVTLEGDGSNHSHGTSVNKELFCVN